MKCQLCLKEKPLLKKSHIVPEFFYRKNNLYDKSHGIQKLVFNKDTQKVIRERNLRTGVYDKKILCAECDNEVIGQYESYLSSLLFGGPIGKNEIPVFKDYIDLNGNEFSEFSNVPCKKLKIGLLSILWRAAISERDFFKKVKLADSYREQLRQMIKNGDFKEISDFPFVLITYRNDSTMPIDMIFPPGDFHHQKGSGFVFIIGGLIILFYISHSFTEQELFKYTCTPNNKIKVIKIKEGTGWDWILEFMNI